MRSQINIKVCACLYIKTWLTLLLLHDHLHVFNKSADKHDCSICGMFFCFVFSDEQQALKQFPSSDPAGESAAQEFCTERGSGLGSVSETCASRCLWDFAKRGGPQVVLWQLHLLSTTMAYAGHHYSRGKNKLYYWRLLKEKNILSTASIKQKNDITADMFPLYIMWL